MNIEIHLLQNFPPSNLNRDDSGAPKDCNFGGHRRQRISSQCLKRSVRQSDTFQKLLDGRLGIRTKRVPQEVAERLVTQGYEATTARTAANALLDELYGLDEKEVTKYLLYVGSEEIQRMADLLYQSEGMPDKAVELQELEEQIEAADKKEQKALTASLAEVKKHFTQLAKEYRNTYPKHVRAVDVALFGRMLASNPDENVDAACQVAHAISVNRMAMEFDYFTAVDDLQPEGSTGAGMIGTVGFSSSCFYQFACVDMNKLADNLGNDEAAARQGAMAFVEAFIHARPSGKQNTFAAHSLPALVMFVVRQSGQPVSLANAFEEPASPADKLSLTEVASEKLVKHYVQLSKMYGVDGQAGYAMLSSDSSSGEQFDSANVSVYESVPDLLQFLESSLTTQATVS